MANPTPEQPDDNKKEGHIELTCGLMKTSVRKGFYDLAGEWHSEPVTTDPLTRATDSDRELLSGEALIFDNSSPRSVIMGRFCGDDGRTLKVDADLQVRGSDGDGGYAEDIYQEGESRGVDTYYTDDIADRGIPRFALQFMHDPNGATVATYSPEVGTGLLPENAERKSPSINFPYLLHGNAKVEKPFVTRMNWMIHQGSQIIRHGDILMIEGQKKVVCLRFFDSKNKGQLSERENPILVKESFSKDDPLFDGDYSIEKLQEYLHTIYTRIE